MVYHQAFLEKSAEDNNWNLDPYCQRIQKRMQEQDSSDDEDLNLKVSKEKYKQLMEGITMSNSN